MTLRTLILLVFLTSAAAAQISQFPNPSDADPKEFTELKGIPFATVNGQKLLSDIYLPTKGTGPFPGVIFIHGGGWSANPRSDDRRQAAYLAAHGMVSATIDYRDKAIAPYPADLDDCRRAIVWLRQHAAEYHVDPNRLALVGVSAGGHLASMLGLENRPGSEVRAVVSISGVYDLSSPAVPAQLAIAITHLIGHPCAEQPEPCRKASPVYGIHPGTPPFLVMHGDSDTLAPTADAEAFVSRMTAAHNRVERFTATGAGHSFWHDAPWILPTEERMNQFLSRELSR